MLNTNNYSMSQSSSQFISSCIFEKTEVNKRSLDDNNGRMTDTVDKTKIICYQLSS